MARTPPAGPTAQDPDAPKGGTPGAGLTTAVVANTLKYDLSIARVKEGEVVEFTPIEVDWTLSVGSLGIAGADPEPVAVDICPTVRPPASASTTGCAHVARAAPRQRPYTGRLSVWAPPAGLQSPLTLVVLKPESSTEEYGSRVAVAEASLPVDTAARYEVAISGFNVLTTRSTSIDTVWVSLHGLIKAVPPHFSESADACKTVGFTTGVAQEIGLAVANGSSKAGMLFLGGWGALSGNDDTQTYAGQLDTEMQKLHSSMFASCDGKLASDVVILPNTTKADRPEFTLDALTRGTGAFPNTAPWVYREKDGDLRCDRRGGAYQVSYLVNGTSWREWGFRPAF
jgi:hypothetical protein